MTSFEQLQKRAKKYGLSLHAIKGSDRFKNMHRIYYGLNGDIGLQYKKWHDNLHEVTEELSKIYNKLGR